MASFICSLLQFPRMLPMAAPASAPSAPLVSNPSPPPIFTRIDLLSMTWSLAIALASCLRFLGLSERSCCLCSSVRDCQVGGEIKFLIALPSFLNSFTNLPSNLQLRSLVKIIMEGDLKRFDHLSCRLFGQPKSLGLNNAFELHRHRL